VFEPAPKVQLSPRQDAVASAIRTTISDASRFPRTFLIQGVTGSGKTEVYLDAVEHCLSLGKRAIVMVPEIALTPQTIERFASRFPGEVAILHSGITAGERFDQWWKVKQGEYGVVIGSRSAVFAPQPDLGLIVMDEEHEWTYKQHDGSPRYHARSVALKMSEETGAVVVLGSASPDVASYYRGLRKEYNLFLLPDRLSSSVSPAASSTTPLADVTLVDMRKELLEGHRDLFSRLLAAAMKDCLDSGDQMILFLNRRGTAAYMQCRNCGYGMRCRRCDVAVTYHRQQKRLVCHYCGERRAVPDKCPSCLAYRLSFYGIGTQMVVDEVQNKFPEASVLRWDRDAARSPKAYEELLTRFRSGKAQVLVGTQMIAKGLHFPNVTLVGVVSADIGLNIPDYRAGERSFQLLCQVAGRAGRGESPGKVIVQTFQPENYAVRSAAEQDYQGFYRKEMSFRRQHSNPPYSKLIRLLYTHTNQAQCEREASQLGNLLRQQREERGLSDIDVLGPMPAYPSRLKGHYRWHIVMRGPEPRNLLDRINVPTGWTIDVDPIALT
jgi:primosomal protein N' (replication factor Y)